MGTLLGLVVAAILVFCLFFAGGCTSRTPSNPTPNAPSNPSPNTAPEPTSGTAPKPPVHAMCYEVAPSSNRADYICPKCGERTLYDIASADHNAMDAAVARMVRTEIAACRREVEELRREIGDMVALDESQFCRRCLPDVMSPRLVLRISVPNSKRRDVEISSYDDVRNLKADMARDT